MDGNANTGSHVDEQRVKAENSHPDSYVGKSVLGLSITRIRTGSLSHRIAG